MMFLKGTKHFFVIFKKKYGQYLFSLPQVLPSSLKARAMQAGWLSLLRRGGNLLRHSARLVPPSARAGTTTARARPRALSTVPALYFPAFFNTTIFDDNFKSPQKWLVNGT